MRVLVCLDTEPNPDPSQCAESAYVEQPSLIPEMTLEQGKEIGHAFLLAVISVVAIKTLLSRKLHRKPT